MNDTLTKIVARLGQATENSQKAHKIADYYGLEHQADKTIEELSELIRALATGERYDVIEEIADVRVMLIQMTYLLGIGEVVFATMHEKIERQLERIEEEEEADAEAKEIYEKWKKAEEEKAQPTNVEKFKNAIDCMWE